MNFSIIIPLYNKEFSIKETIESVLNQTYAQFELLIVDDGSTDNSFAIASSFDDKRITCYRKKNGGVSSARNFGIKYAKNEWLFFLDADDLLNPCALETIVKINQIFPDYLFYVGNMQLYGGMRCKKISGLAQVSVNPFKDWWHMRLAPEMGTFAMHRSMIDKIGYFDERISCYEDLDFTSRLMDKIPFVYTSQCIKIYRKEFSQLSVELQPLNREFAYYLTKERVQGSMWKQLVLAYNVWDTRRHRFVCNDFIGANIYTKKLCIFCLPVRWYINIMDLKRKIGEILKNKCRF